MTVHSITKPILLGLMHDQRRFPAICGNMSCIELEWFSREPGAIIKLSSCAYLPK
jgi:hypothetical protein